MTGERDVGGAKSCAGGERSHMCRKKKKTIGERVVGIKVPVVSEISKERKENKKNTKKQDESSGKRVTTVTGERKGGMQLVKRGDVNVKKQEHRLLQEE